MDLNEAAERALRMVRESRDLSYDTEGSGLDWKTNNPTGFVIGAPKADGSITQDDVVYVPTRHGGGGNLPGSAPLQTPTDRVQPHPWEVELGRAFDDRNRTRASFGRVVGHHMKFDVHFSANVGVFLGRQLACTQNQEAMLDEYARSYSLDACAKRHGVTEKLGDDLYAHIARQFGGPAERSSMQHFWRLAGNDPIATDYACGDAVSTWELYQSQQKKIDEEEIRFVADLENDLIWTIYRMERKGIKVDLNRVDQLRYSVEQQIKGLLADFPLGFNVRSPLMIKKAFEEADITNWPKTEKGAPSFTEKFLAKSELGRKVIEIRQASNLINTFVNPLAERHTHTDGRVHATLNQLKSDEKGTISGRFSCNDPNLQQVPKRNKAVAKPFRRLFVADEGKIFWERDYSQCFVAGTQVSVPGGTKNIEDMQPGDWVYSYDENRKLVLRRVTWAGQTGVKPVFRVHWATNGRTKGHVDCTGDHRIRKVDGEYVTVDALFAMRGQGYRCKNPLWVPVLALRRANQTDSRSGYVTPILFATGAVRIKESRFVFEQVNGWSPEEVHHDDENSTNNTPDNLTGMTSEGHRSKHIPYGMGKLNAEQRKGRSMLAIDGLRRKFAERAEGGAVHNHAITDVEDLQSVQAVYDITVEDTHNFIANQICVHNCEPRLFAHYSQDPNLLAGYNSEPFVDVHTTVATLLDVERDPTAKRMNMGIFTGMQTRAFADHMGWSLEKASQAWNAWYRAFPAIKGFQDKAKARLENRGYVFSLLGRRQRLEERRFAYRGTSKIIQSSNADIVKLKLLEADRTCEDNGDIVQILMTVHDSFNGQRDNTPEAKALLDEIVFQMEQVQIEPFNLTVPFIMEGTEGGDWMEATWGPEKVAA